MEVKEDKNFSGKNVKKVLTIVFLLSFIAMTIFFVYEYSKGRFKSEDSLREYIDSFGIYGPLVLAFFQATPARKEGTAKGAAPEGGETLQESTER